MLNFGVNFIFVFNGTIQTILVAFSMKTSRASNGMLSSKNDDFKFLKTAKNINVHHTCSSRARGTVLFLQST